MGAPRSPATRAATIAGSGSKTTPTSPPSSPRSATRTNLRGRDRLRHACPQADAFLDALAVRGHPLAGETTRLLRLLDQVGASALDGALAEARARGAISAASVAHVLDQRRRARRPPPLIDLVLPADPRVRDLRVTPHTLSAYDTLLTPPPAAAEEMPDGPAR